MVRTQLIVFEDIDCLVTEPSQTETCRLNLLREQHTDDYLKEVYKTNGECYAVGWFGVVAPSSPTSRACSPVGMGDTTVSETIAVVSMKSLDASAPFP